MKADDDPQFEPIEKGLANTASLLAELISQEEPHPRTQTAKAYKEKLAHEVASDLIVIKKRIENGVAHLVKALKELASTHPEIHSNEIAVEFAKTTEFFSEFPVHAESYLTAIAQDQSLQEICGISETTIESLYQAAKQIYEKQNYSDAAEAFTFLTLLNSKKYTFWIALGNAEYLCHRYEQALVAYAIAVRVDPGDPTSHVYACKCYEEIQEFDNAVNALDLALFVIGESKSRDFENLKRQVTAKREKLIKKIKDEG